MLEDEGRFQSMYNDSMKNRTWHIVLTVLLVLLTAAVSFCGLAFFQFERTVESIAQDFTALQNRDENGVVIADSTQLAKFYGELFDQMQKYGDLDTTEEAFAGLVSQVFVKTMKDCTVESVQFDQDKIIVNVHGVAVPADELNDQLLVTSAGKAALRYLSNDFLGAAASIFQGTDGIKRELYGRYASELLTTLKEEIMAKQAVPVYYTLTLRLEQDQWIIEAFEQNQEAASPNEEVQTQSQQISSLQAGSLQENSLSRN